ncbi:MAG: type II toxin-antitoxin system HicB family antitoxin [Candidatus Pacearchaeota archaeon]
MAKFNVVIEKGEDGYLISEVIELPGCHTQGKTMEELISNTKEAITLYLRVIGREKIRDKFIGIKKLEI